MTRISYSTTTTTAQPWGHRRFVTSWIVLFLLVCLWTVDPVHGSVQAAVVDVDLTGMVAEAEAEEQDNNNNNPQPPVVLSTAEHGARQIAWVRAEGGFVHEAFDIRRVDPADPSSRTGVFASHDLPKGTVLLEIPRHVLMNGGWHQTCTTVQMLADELGRTDLQHSPWCWPVCGPM